MCCGNVNMGKATHGQKETRACDCCTIVDKDTTAKQVAYCYVCNAWLCGPCEKDLIKRGKAFVKNIMG